MALGSEQFRPRPKVRALPPTVPNVYETPRPGPKYVAFINASMSNVSLHYGPAHQRPVAKIIEACQWRNPFNGAVQVCTEADKKAILRWQKREAKKLRWLTVEAAKIILQRFHDYADAHPDKSDQVIFREVYEATFKGDKLRQNTAQDPQKKIKDALIARLRDTHGIDVEDLAKREPNITIARLRHLVLHPEDATVLEDFDDSAHLVNPPVEELVEESVDTEALALRNRYMELATTLGVRPPPGHALWRKKRLQEEVATLERRMKRVERERNAIEVTPEEPVVNVAPDDPEVDVEPEELPAGA